jgi:hypothetical protein
VGKTTSCGGGFARVVFRQLLAVGKAACRSQMHPRAGCTELSNLHVPPMLHAPNAPLSRRELSHVHGNSVYHRCWAYLASPLSHDVLLKLVSPRGLGLRRARRCTRPLLAALGSLQHPLSHTRHCPHAPTTHPPGKNRTGHQCEDAERRTPSDALEVVLQLQYHGSARPAPTLQRPWSYTPSNHA